MQEFISVLTGQRTEYNDPKFVCRTEGRKGIQVYSIFSLYKKIVTRVISDGAVKIQLHVLTKDMVKYGYTEQPFGVSTPVPY